MSEAYKTCKTTSSLRSTSKRPNSANSRATNTTIQIQKREKLKNLLVEKFVKKFSVKEYKYLIEREVSDFIKKEKLTEIDLKNFENHLANLISGNNYKKEIKNNLDNKVYATEIQNKNENYEKNYLKNDKNLYIDIKSDFSNKDLNNKINSSKHKNNFLKSANNKLNSKNTEIHNGNLEKSKKIIIHKNNPTVLNNNKNINEKLNNNNINNTTNTNKNNLKNNLDKNNDNMSRFSKVSKNSIKNNLNLEEQERDSVYNEKSRPMSVRNLIPKNIQLENNDTEKDLMDQEELIDFDFDIEDIKNFELKKLFKDDKKPIDRVNFEDEKDEWQLIDNYKKNLHQNRLEEGKMKDRDIKKRNREAFDKQLREKEIVKDQKKIMDLLHHEKIMSNVEKLQLEEMKKLKEIEDKKLREKVFREEQIKESIIKKKRNYLENLKNDKKLCIYKQN